MKRKSLLILAVLVTALACLFTSCSGSVEPPRAEEYGYVTFGNGSSRSLSTEYGIKSYDELYWYYTAVKKDNYGLTGQKTTQTKVPAKNADGTGIGSGTVGPFSQGAWEFELFAYDAEITGTSSDNLVYQGKSAIIILKGDETKAVPVSVSLQGVCGLINVSQAYFEWANGSDATGQIYVTIELASNTSTGSPYFFGPLTRSSDKYTFGTISDSFTVPADYYTCTVNAYMLEDVIVPEEGSKTVKADATPLATQTFGLRVYGNATTYIKGNLTEGLFADVVFKVANQDMKVFVPTSSGSAEITNISATPSGEGTTSVSFSAGALSNVQDDATLQLDVKVTSIESANEKFNIVGVDTNNKSAYAGIDITLMQTTSDGNSSPVESFNDNTNTTATVTTYIAKGLSGVSVHYTPAEGDTEDYTIGTETQFSSGTVDGYYETETGKLVFKTSHFSEYYVLADCKTVNVTTNVGYPSFIDGYQKANDGDVLVLYSDEIVFPESLSAKKNVTIKGRSLSNKTIVRGLKSIDKLMENLVLENLDFIQTSTLTIQGKNILFNNCDFSAKETSYWNVPAGLNNGGYTDITKISNAENIVFNECKFSGKGKDSDLPNARLISSPSCKDLTINNSEFKDCFSAIYYSHVKGVLEVNRSEFNCYAYTVHCGGDNSCELLVSDSILNGWTSFASSANTNASFSNCSFGSYESGYHCMVPYMNTTFDKCVFDSGYEIYNRYNTQKSMNFDNCKKGDNDLTNDNFKGLFRNEADQETVYLWNRSVCYVNGSPVEKDPAKIEKEVKGEIEVYFFETLEDAVRVANDGDTITLLDNTSGNGIGLYVNGDNNSKIKTKNITIDFNNYTYTIDGSLQGSIGFVSQAFHLEKDCSVTLKNGTITSEKAAMLIQNYCNLTLDNMCLVFGDDYPLSNNAGNILIKDTTITAKDGNGIAFDVYSFGGYSGTTVTVEGNSVINGKIELDRENSAPLKLVIIGGEFNGEISQKVSNNCVVEITGGTFSSDPSEYIQEGCEVVEVEGMYEVVGDTAVVKTAAELKAILTAFTDAGSGNATVSIEADITLADGETWTPVTVDGYHGAGVITVEGKGHTISGLNAPLFAGGFAGKSGIVIKDLTLKNTTIVDNTNSLGIGAFINTIDSMPRIELNNCHLKNSSITSTAGARVGGLIGWTSGYNNPDDGPVDTYVKITSCSVEYCTITAAGSVGAIIGHAGSNPATYHTITGCTVTGTTLNSTDDGDWRVGVVVGTANIGEVTISGTTESSNTLTQTGKTAPEHSNLYGRFVPNSTGKLTIGGVEIK